MANAKKSEGTNMPTRIDASINAAMVNKERDGTIQRDMTLAILSLSLSEFSPTAIIRLLDNKATEFAGIMQGKEGAATKKLSELSPAFAEKLATFQRLRKASTDKNTAPQQRSVLTLQSQAVEAQVKAALSMFGRAVRSAYYLLMTHKGDVSEIVAVSANKGALSYKVPDPHATDPKKADAVRVASSGADLTRNGDKLVREKLGKAPPRARAAGDVADIGAKGLPMAVNGVTTFLDLNDKEQKTGFRPIDDYKDDEAAALETLLVRLMRVKFGDEKGLIDPKLVADWVKASELDKASIKVPPTQKPDETKGDKPKATGTNG